MDYSFVTSPESVHKELLKILHFTHDVEVDNSNYAISFNLHVDYIDWLSYPCLNQVVNGKLMITNVTETKNIGYFQVTMIKADCSTDLCKRILSSITELQSVAKKTIESSVHLNHLVSATKQVFESLTLDRYCTSPTTLHFMDSGVITKLLFRGNMEAGKYYSPDSLELSIKDLKDDSTIIYKMGRLTSEEYSPPVPPPVHKCRIPLGPEKYSVHVGIHKNENNEVIESKMTITNAYSYSVVEELSLQQELLDSELTGVEGKIDFKRILDKDFNIFS